MKKSKGTKVFVWLLVLLQLVVCTALADTVINLTTFNAFEQTGNYTVRFWTELPPAAADGSGEAAVTAEGAQPSTLIFEKTGVGYGTLVRDLLPELYAVAPDYNEQTFWTVDEDNYLVLNNLDIAVQGTAVARLGDTYYLTLQEAINDATTEGATVYLLNDTKEGISIVGKDIILDLGGHTINAKDKTFTAENSDLTIKQGSIIGAFGFAAPGVSFTSGTLDAEYLTLENNTSFCHDGGVYLSGVKATMTHCQLLSNMAIPDAQSGAIYLAGGSELTGVDLTVKKNAAGANGGAFYVSSNSTLSLTDSTLSNNTAKNGNGGAIYLEDRATLTVGGSVGGSTVLSANGANNGNGSGIYMAGGSIKGSGLEILGDSAYTCSEGAGIYAAGGTIELSSSSISNNIAKKNGGGVYLKGATLIGNGLKIEGNDARNGFGAGIYVDAGGSVTGSVTVSGNQVGNGVGSQSNGAGVYVAADGSVNASMTISGNTGANNGGGMYVAAGANVTLYDCSIEGHQSKKSGGGIYLNGGSLTAKNLTVSGNKCASEHGGGIYANGGTISVSEGSFATVTNNESLKGDGGGLYLNANASLTGGSLNITGNKAAYSGGGAYLVSGGSIKNSLLTVSGNTAGSSGAVANGGGINMYGGSVVALEGSTISANTCTDGGAGVWMGNNSTLTSNGLNISDNISNCNGGGIFLNGTNTLDGTSLTISGNRANNPYGDGGGGIFVRGGTITMTVPAIVSGNRSTHYYGGGVFLQGSSLTASNLTVSGNTASNNGGGVYLGAWSGNGSNSTLTGTVHVTGNTSSKQGGGMYLSKGSTLSLTDSQIDDNVSKTEKGGGIYADTASITLTGGTVNRNKTEDYDNGAGIYASNGTLTASGTTFEGNIGTNDGGAIYFKSSGTLTLENCTFRSNSARMNGAVYAGGSQNTITGCDFLANKANTNAAALKLEGVSTVTGGNISQNTGTDTGDAHGALYVVTHPATIDGVRFEGNQCATTIWTNQDLTFANCVIANNTCLTGHASYSTGIATVYLFGPPRNTSFTNCEIHDNKVDSTTNTYGKTAEIYLDTNGTLTLNKTRVHHNSGGKSGGIYSDAAGAITIANGSVIADNTGAECGGIYIKNANAKLTIGEGTAVYDNTATESTANDLRIVKMAPTNSGYISTIEANQMVDGSVDFSDYYWVDEENKLPLMKLVDGKVVYEDGKLVYNPVPPKYGNERYYTAKPLDVYVVAVVEHADGTETEYLTLLEAVEAAQNGETVRLIYDSTDEKKNSPIAESIEVAGKNITLNLNGRKLIARTGESAITVQTGAALTLIGDTNENANSECATTDNTPVIVNHGTLSIGGGVSAKRVEHRGEALTLDTTGKIESVYLDKDAADPTKVKAVTGGANFNPEAITFELDSNVLAALNQGYLHTEAPVIVTLVQPAQDVALSPDLLDNKVTVRGANGFVKLAISTEGNLVACATELNGVFVDGQSGNDDLDGLTPASRVQTFERAKEVLKEQLLRTDLTDDQKAAIQGIYVMGKINVTGEKTWDMSDAHNKPLLRYPTYTGAFAEVTGTLTLKNIVLDGCGDKTPSTAALIRCDGALNIESGATLQNNWHTILSGNYTEAGGAVYGHGTVNMNGGSIVGNKSWYGGGICLWDGTLVMNSGSISGNRAENLGSYEAIGGGVALLHKSTMQMHAPAIVSGNSSQNIGGGIAVGGDNNLTTSTEVALTMDGGTISGNSSWHEGGGVYIQAGGTGRISAGEISGNSAASKGGQFGGGGIYVNGDRGYGLGPGRLYLTNVNISGNHADVAGGGLAGCPTSKTAVYVGSGGVIYGNTCVGQNELQGPEIYIDNHVAAGWSGIPETHISEYMLGGVPYNWYSVMSGEPVSPAVLSKTKGHLTLDNKHTRESASYAISKCGLKITGNTSGENGGGVGSNGFVQIGVVPTKGEWTPTGTKTLTGRTMEEGEFTFTVTENGTPVSWGKNKASTADGQAVEIEFTSINYDGQALGTKHTYVITEDIPANKLPGVGYDQTSFTVNVTVIESAEGKLTGYVTSIEGGDTVAFENTYTTTPAKAQLSVHKTVQGQPIKPETFTFEMALKAGQANGVDMPASTTATVQGTGDAQFGEMTFTKPGDYLFSIKETKGDASYYKYDQSEWEAAVKVVDDNAVLKATITYSKPGAQNTSAAEFVNPYTPSAATLSLPVSKTISGLTPPTSKTFAFTLTAQNGAPMPQDAHSGTSTLTITGAGKATFGQITYTKVGTYSYVVKETAGTDTGYAYDTKEYNVTVRVVDLGGRLSASWTVGGQTMDALSFVNPYQPNVAEVKLPVRKQITGGERRPAGTFTFTLEAVTENAPMPPQNTVTLIGDGDAEFGAIRFTQAGTWTYKVSEQDSQEQNYVYDHRVYTITVRVTDENGVLKAEWMTESGSTEPLTFINNYITPSPTPAPTPTPGPEYTTVTVTKRWEDANDAEGIRPASITVSLERSVAGGAYEAVNTIRMTGEGNTWTYTFDQLPARDDQGRRYQYRVREDAVTGYAVQYDGNTITNIHVAVTPTPEGTPMPTPVVVGPTPPGAKGMKYVDGEWLWIDDLGVPLGVVAQTGDNDNLPAVLGGMAALLVIAGMLVLMIARKKNRKNA